MTLRCNLSRRRIWNPETNKVSPGPIYTSTLQLTDNEWRLFCRRIRSVRMHSVRQWRHVSSRPMASTALFFQQGKLGAWGADPLWAHRARALTHCGARGNAGWVQANRNGYAPKPARSLQHLQRGECNRGRTRPQPCHALVDRREPFFCTAGAAFRRLEARATIRGGISSIRGRLATRLWARRRAMIAAAFPIFELP